MLLRSLTAAALDLLLGLASADAQTRYPGLDMEPACRTLTPTAAGGPRPLDPDVLVLRSLGVANYELTYSPASAIRAISPETRTLDVLYRTPVCFNTATREMAIGW